MLEIKVDKYKKIMKNNSPVVRRNVQLSKTSLGENIMVKTEPVVNNALNEAILNDELPEEDLDSNTFFEVGSYSILKYDYKQQDWVNTGMDLTADCGAHKTLGECIKANLAYINRCINHDGNYRYIVLVVDKIDKDGYPIPDSECYGARVFDGKIVETWTYDNGSDSYDGLFSWL